MSVRRRSIVVLAVCVYPVLLAAIDIYQAHPHDGGGIEGAFTVDAWLGLVTILASVGVGALTRSWWGLLAAVLVVPEMEILRAAVRVFHGTPLPVSLLAYRAAYLAVLMAFGVLASNSRLRARLRGVRKPDPVAVERYTRHPHPLP